MPYATKTEVEDWLGHEVPDVDRKIRNAELLIGEVLIWSLDDPTIFDADQLVDLRDAVCAQIEFWEQVGHEHETGGIFGDVEGVKVPGRLGRRARSALLRHGLLTRAVHGVL